MTAFTSAASEATAVRKNVFENGIGKNSSSYRRTWNSGEDTYLRSDRTTIYLVSENWSINSTAGSVIRHYIPTPSSTTAGTVITTSTNMYWVADVS